MSAYKNLQDWIEGKSPSELDVLEHQGEVRFKDTILQVRPGQKPKETPVLFRLPTGIDLLEARLEALDFVNQRVKAKLGREVKTVAEAVAVVGNGSWDEVDTSHVLARCVLRADPPHDPLALPQFMMTAYRNELSQMAKKLDAFAKLQGPQIDIEMNEGEFRRLLETIVKKRSLSPLAVIDGNMRDNFVRTMAVRLASLLIEPSSSPQPEPGLPES